MVEVHKMERDIPNIDANLLQTWEDDDNHLEKKQQKIVEQAMLDISIIAADP
jgi:hypothetical protein